MLARQHSPSSVTRSQRELKLKSLLCAFHVLSSGCVYLGVRTPGFLVCEGGAEWAGGELAAVEKSCEQDPTGKPRSAGPGVKAVAAAPAFIPPRPASAPPWLGTPRPRGTRGGPRRWGSDLGGRTAATGPRMHGQQIWDRRADLGRGFRPHPGRPRQEAIFGVRSAPQRPCEPLWLHTGSLVSPVRGESGDDRPPRTAPAQGLVGSQQWGVGAPGFWLDFWFQQRWQVCMSERAAVP